MATAKEIALSHGLCTCDEAYKKRNLTAPYCPWHSTAVEEAMIAYGNAKLDEAADVATTKDVAQNILQLKDQI